MLFWGLGSLMDASGLRMTQTLFKRSKYEQPRNTRLFKLIWIMQKLHIAFP